MNNQMINFKESSVQCIRLNRYTGYFPINNPVAWSIHISLKHLLLLLIIYSTAAIS